MSGLTDDEAEALRGWLEDRGFDHVWNGERDSAMGGERQDLWERDGTLLRLTQAGGRCFCDLSRGGREVWLDVDRIAAAMGSESTVPVERVADVVTSINDRVFGALSSTLTHSP